MSKLDELITELCSDGVDYKKIKEVASVTAGNSAPQKQEFFVNGKHPFCRTADVGKARKSVDFNSITDKLNDDGIRGLRLFPKGSILIPKSGASTLLNNRVRLSIDSYVVSHLAVIIPNEQIINSKFLYYAIEGFDMGTLVEDISYPSVKSSKIADSIVIPLPPLPVQLEIVRILDNFTELTVELTAELTARKKQYEYYRNALLTVGSDVKWMHLGDVCENIASGTNKDRSELGNYPVFGSTGIIAYSDTYKYNEELLLVARVGANAGYVHRAKGKFDVSDNTLIVKPRKGYSPSFAYYQLLNFNLNTLAVGGGQPLITAGKLKKIKIPVPSIEEQERIVSILDRFDALVNDISSGIPGEIESRRKQYEYYRDQLLSFKEAKL